MRDCVVKVRERDEDLIESLSSDIGGMVCSLSVLFLLFLRAIHDLTLSLELFNLFLPLGIILEGLALGEALGEGGEYFLRGLGGEYFLRGLGGEFFLRGLSAGSSSSEERSMTSFFLANSRSIDFRLRIFLALGLFFARTDSVFEIVMIGTLCLYSKISVAIRSKHRSMLVFVFAEVSKKVQPH